LRDGRPFPTTDSEGVDPHEHPKHHTDLNRISRPDLVRALEGIADDLAVVVTQLAAVTA
jgi:hypothetical protein